MRALHSPNSRLTRDNDTPVEMRNLNDSDIIDGCTDELARLTRQAWLSR